MSSVQDWISQWNTHQNFGRKDTFDPRAAAAGKANSYQNTADANMSGSIDSAGAGVNAANQGVNAANQAGAQVNSSILNMNQNAGLATNAAYSMSGSISNVQDNARLVNQQAGALLPYASTLRGYADTMWDQGTGLVGRGNSVLNTGSDIMNLNAGAGGIAGDYVNWLNSVDPNKYVSGAASDVQSSYSNASGQLDRSLSRSGVSSGRALSMKEQFAQGLAAALAGAKTRARQQGLADKGKALTGAMEAARGMFETGGNLTRTGVESQTAAASSQSSAANIEGQAGSLYGQAGALHGQAGQLQGAQADAYTRAGQAYGAAGQLAIGNADMMVKAYGNVTSANNALSEARAKAAKYYAEVAQGHGENAGSKYLYAL